ncbi:MAG: segregation and condensation protein [Clostridia bacterium]|nr:segregation and condensation protein [Clostridia bacterium]MDN5322905.1 segregation and condensation protein [Clostridia bacterium]
MKNKERVCLLFLDETKAIVESLLFVSNEPLSIKQLSEIININPDITQRIVEDLQAEYTKNYHGFHLIEVAEGFLFVTKPEYDLYIQKLFKPQLSTLSHAALETLAIIAYKQPITRSEIELIRGVKVDKIVNTLVEKNLIEELGRKEGPGRPIVYGTTKDFLKYFGLKDLSQLPSLENLKHQEE